MTQALAEAKLAAFKGALEAYLAEAAGADSVEIQSVRPLTGGAIQENWLLEVIIDGQRRDLVLRSDAVSGVAASHDRAEEFALLKAAWAAGVTVPAPLWLCTDAAVLGRPFYFMARVPGTAEGRLIVKPDGPGGDKDVLAERLGEELAKIHAITPPRPDLDFLDLPKTSPALEAVALYRGYLDAIGRPYPGLEWAGQWPGRDRAAAPGLPYRQLHGRRVGTHGHPGLGVRGLGRAHERSGLVLRPLLALRPGP
jgi:aminoglycoside phosphotransferase (APT) family kinase protein